MEFLVIVLFVAAIFVANLLVSRALRRRKQAQGESSPGKAAPAASRTSVEAAREANARLDAAAHQQVYAAIAQGQPIKAVKLYAQFTGVGVRMAGAAVENLATHPQPFQPPRPAAPAAGAGETRPAQDATEAKGAAEAKETGPVSESKPVRDAKPVSNAEPVLGAKPAKQQPDTAASARKEKPEEDEISKWVKNLRPEDF